MLVLSGRSQLRFSAECVHQIINDSDEELRYQAASTMEEPDIGRYPDSGKFAVFAGTHPGSDRRQYSFTYVGRPDSAVDYRDGK